MKLYEIPNKSKIYEEVSDGSRKDLTEKPLKELRHEVIYI